MKNRGSTRFFRAVSKKGAVVSSGHRFLMPDRAIPAKGRRHAWQGQFNSAEEMLSEMTLEIGRDGCWAGITICDRDHPLGGFSCYATLCLLGPLEGSRAIDCLRCYAHYILYEHFWKQRWQCGLSKISQIRFEALDNRDRNEVIWQNAKGRHQLARVYQRGACRLRWHFEIG
jgi:hypothetical protein